MHQKAEATITVLKDIEMSLEKCKLHVTEESLRLIIVWKDFGENNEACSLLLLFLGAPLLN
jgi:hypothetical protein